MRLIKEQYPVLQIIDADPVIAALAEAWAPLTAEKAVQLVMGMLIKDLIGSLTTTFHVLARSAAVAYARNPAYPGTGPEKVQKAYEGVFEIFFPVSENVFDGRKDLGKEADLLLSAKALQTVMSGGVLDTSAFGGFLSGDLPARFKNIVKLASGFEGDLATLAGCRDTAVGTIVAGATAGRARATQRVIDALLRTGMKPAEILPALQADALGTAFLPMKRGGGASADGKEGPARDPFSLGEHDGTLPGIFHSLLYLGEPVCRVLEVTQVGRDELSVRLRVTPRWLPAGTKITTCRVVVNLPDPVLREKDARRVSRDGHMLIQRRGCVFRIYRPRLRVVEGALVMETFAGWLQGVLLEALKRMPGVQEGQSPKAVSGSVKAWRVERVFADTIVEAFGELQVVQQKTRLDLGEDPLLAARQTASAMILAQEYPLLIEHPHSMQERHRTGGPPTRPIEPTKDTLLSWSRREEILRLAVAGGYDILSTSKNKPGQVATKVGRAGVPSYLLAMNPFAWLLDPKRRPEPREMKKREPLFWQAGTPLLAANTAAAGGPRCDGGGMTRPKVRSTVGCPPALIEGMREVVCLIADTNLNHFGQDTLTCTAALWDNLRLRCFDIECATIARAEERLAELEAAGYDRAHLKLAPREDAMAGGLTHESWIITVEAEHGIRDVGKLKSCVGPVKGVPSLMPGVRLFAGGREIELIVPRDTVVKKKALDFWLAMACEAIAHARGETEYLVTPGEDLAALVARVRADLALVCGDPDGLVEITDQDGTVLGRGMVGAVPFFRPVQTKIGTYRLRDAANPCDLELHAAIMLGVGLTLTGEENARFVSLCEAYQNVRVEQTDEDVSRRAATRS